MCPSRYGLASSSFLCFLGTRYLSTILQIGKEHTSEGRNRVDRSGGIKSGSEDGCPGGASNSDHTLIIDWWRQAKSAALSLQ
jgi:hypothetical protein